MPSARVHDGVTFLLAVPAGVAIYAATHDLTSSIVAAIAFVFGGLMFGPDLDTVSRQYSRWSFVRLVWLPYRHFFKHRSRFSHGLIFGALIRVFYFCGVVTLLTFAAAYVYVSLRGGRPPGISDVPIVWRPIDTFLRGTFGKDLYWIGFVGLWLGAASHTLTDVAGSFIKTGRVAKFL